MVSGCETSIEFRHAVIIGIDGEPVSGSSTLHVALDLSKFQSGRWALQLDSVFARRREPAIVLAQGVACLAVAWWAQLSPRSYMQAIRGAVFLSPLTIGFGQESIAAAARLGPSTKLPFPSIVVGASYPIANRILALADSWGSHFVETGIAPEDHPTNRHPALGEDERQLMRLLPLLRGASPAVWPHEVEPAEDGLPR